MARGGNYLFVGDTMTNSIEENKHRNIDSISSTDILENTIREQMPGILDILLIDRTTSTSKKKKNYMGKRKLCEVRLKILCGNCSDVT